MINYKRCYGVVKDERIHFVEQGLGVSLPKFYIKSAPSQTGGCDTRSLYLMNSVQQNPANERESIVNAVSQMTYVSQDLKRCSQTITEKMQHPDTSTQEIMSKEMQKVSQLITEEVSNKILNLLSARSDALIQKLQSTGVFT